MTFSPEVKKAVRQSQKHASYDRTGLYPVTIAAQLAFLHPGTVRRWIQERRIPAYGWRGSYRVRLEDLLPEHSQDGGK